MSNRALSNDQKLFAQCFQLCLDQKWEEAQAVLLQLSPSMLERVLLIKCQDDTGDTLLHRAVRESKHDFVTSLLKVSTAKISLQKTANSRGSLLIDVAACYGTLETVKSVLEAVSDEEILELLTHCHTGDQQTPLHVAVQMNSVDVVAYMTSRKGFSLGLNTLKLADDVGQNVLNFAVKNKKHVTIKVLLDSLNQSEIMKLLTDKSRNMSAAIHSAAEHGTAATMACILDSLDYDNRSMLMMTSASNEWTPLHYAARENTDEMIAAILAGIKEEHRLDHIINTEKKGWSSLHFAARYGTPASMEVLVAAIPGDRLFDAVKRLADGALTVCHLSACNQEMDTLTAVCSRLQHDELLALLKLKDEDTQTITMRLAKYNKRDNTEWLMSRLSPQEIVELLKVKDKQDFTALHLAANHSCTEVMMALLEKVDREHWPSLVRECSNKKCNVLHLLVRNGSSDSVAFILDGIRSEAKSILMMRDEGGWTVLHSAARYSSSATFIVLLSAVEQEHWFEMMSSQISKSQWYVFHLLIRNIGGEAVMHVMRGLSADETLQLMLLEIGDGATPLHLAAECTSAETVSCLLNSIESVPDRWLLVKAMKARSKHTCLHLAAHHNSAEALSSILSSLEGENQRVEALELRDRQKLLPLHHAVRYNKRCDVIIAALEQLEASNRLRILKCKSGDNHNLLSYAATHSTLPVVEGMLDKLDNPDYRLEVMRQPVVNGWCALQMAVQYNSSEVVGLLLNSVSESALPELLVMAEVDNWSLLHIASRYNSSGDTIKVIFQLLSNQGDLKSLVEKQNSSGETALHLALYCNRKEVMRGIVEALDTACLHKLIGITDQSDWNCLHHACSSLDEDQLTYLLGKLESSSLPDLLSLVQSDMQNCLCLATLNNNAQAVKCVADNLRGHRDAYVAVDSSGMTALHYCVQKDNTEKLGILMAVEDIGTCVAMLKVENSEGITPLVMAVDGLSYNVVQEMMCQLLATSRRSDDAYQGLFGL